VSETPAYTARRGSLSERRLHVRHRVSSLVYADVGADNGGIVVDLNEDGMALQAVVPLAKNADINLRVQLPNSRSTFETGAEIVWVGESKRLAGMRFLDLSLEARTLIREWIHSEILPKSTVEQSLALPPSASDVPQGTQQGPKPLLESPKSRWLGSVAEFRLPPHHEEQASGSIEGTEKSPRTPTLRELSSRLQAASSEPIQLLKGPNSTSDPGTFQQAFATVDAGKSPGTSNSDDLSKGSLSLLGSATTAQGDDASVNGFASLTRELPTPPASVPQSSFQLRLAPPPASSSFERGEFASGSESKLSAIQEGILSIAARIDRGPGIKRTAAAVALLIVALVCGGIWMTMGSRATHTVFLPPEAGPANDVVGTAAESTDSILPSATEVPSNSQIKNGSIAKARNVSHQRSGAEPTARSAPVQRTHEDAPFALTQALAPATPVKPQDATLAPAPVVESVAVGPQSLATLTATKTVDRSLQPPQVLEDSQPPRIVAGHVLRPVDRFNPAHLTYRVEPVYPAEAQKQGIEGTVKIHQVIAADGSVESVKLVSGPEPLTAAAMDAAQHWRYLPALLNGQPVDTEQDIQIDFRLHQ